MEYNGGISLLSRALCVVEEQDDQVIKSKNEDKLHLTVVKEFI